MPVMEFACSQPPALSTLVVPHNPAGTTPHPIMSQLDPLGLLVKAKMPSPKSARIIGQHWKISAQFRPASKKGEDAGLLPGGKSLDLATEFDCSEGHCRNLVSATTQSHGLGREIESNVVPWELQYNRGVPHRPLAGKQAKAPKQGSKRYTAFS